MAANSLLYFLLATGLIPPPDESVIPDGQFAGCGENERFTECGSGCRLTCDNFDNPPQICPAICRIGCECESGFVRSADGRCVRPEECPNRSVLSTEGCPVNAHYEECGTACPTTCSNYHTPPKMCVFMCVSGCFCDEGYVRTKEGKCVKPEGCGAETKNCIDKPETGPCKAHMPMFYYDKNVRDCKQFIYGGCGGNGNRYATKEQCLKNCAAKNCIDKPETGPCKAHMPMFYYDKNSRDCKQFIYGGCRGNGNRYATKKQCLENCADIFEADAGVNRCFLPAEIGLCKAHITRFYYSKTARKCQKFIYGGCGGNLNNFKTEEDCKRACVYPVPF